MKKFLVRSLVSVLLLATGVCVGGWVQHAKTGHHYELWAEKQIQGPTGQIHWTYACESVGLPFLDPGTTSIEVDGRFIYKAKRVFQEKYPYATNIRTNRDLIEWDDGEYSFSLHMQKMQKQGEHKGAGTGEEEGPR